MAAGSIVVDLLMKTGSFETDTKRAEKRLAEMKKEAQAMGVAVGAAFTAVAAASVAMVKSSIDAMDEMSKTAQKVGTSVEAFSALAYAADLSGVSQEQLGSALVKLSKNISDAAMGTGDAEEAFKKMGISIRNADGSLKSADKVLGEMAGKFPGYADGTEKTALAIAALGKTGADLIPLLNSGSAGLAEMTEEARRLGVVLDTDAAKAAEEFNDNLSRMGAAVQGVANQAATELLPALKDISQMLVDVAKNETTMGVATDIVKAAVGGLITVFQTIAVVGSDVGFVFLSVGREIGAWAAQIAALGRGDLAGFRAISDAVKADGERARAELDKFQARVMGLGGGTMDDEARRRLGRGATAPKLAAAPRLSSGKKGADPDADFKAYLNTLQQQVQKVGELTAAEKLLDDLRRGSLTVSNEAQFNQLWGLAQMVDREKELAAAAKDRMESGRAAAMAAGDEVTKANEEYQALIKRLLDGGPAAQLEKQRKEMQALADEFARGAINADQFNDAATGALNLVAEKAPEAKSMTEELGLTFASAFEEAVLGGGDLSDVFKGLLQDIARVILRLAVIEPMMKKLKEATEGGGAGSGLGGLLGGLFGSGGGSAGGGFGTGAGFGNMDFGGFFADGGSPPVGRVSVVGERGPELFVPRTAGAIVPNHALGGGQDKLTLINQTTGRVDRVVEQRISPTERALILQEAREMVAGDLKQPNSRISRSLGSTHNVRRNR
jgi:hypothetical protein